jgi:uncharacterized membrane protein (UPF0127 family)
MSRILALTACVVGAVAAAWLGIVGCRKAPQRPGVILNGKRWSVELAVTPPQRFVGLSGRGELADDAGMLFVYPGSAVLEFCMRGCTIPLDIAFLDERRRVVHTATMAVEPDRVGRVVYSSQRPAKYALEVAAGALAAAGVKVGDEAAFIGDIPR